MAQEACDQAPDWGPAWWARALAYERSGDAVAARQAFLRSARSAQEPIDPPVAIAWEDFQDCVAAAQADLPPAIAKAAAACHLILDDYTPAAFVTESGDDDCYELLGLFSGHPLPDQNYEGHGDTAATIHIWRRPHEHCCQDRDECLAEIRNTYYHELGHYLGYDENGIASLGLS